MRKKYAASVAILSNRAAVAHTVAALETIVLNSVLSTVALVLAFLVSSHTATTLVSTHLSALAVSALSVAALSDSCADIDLKVPAVATLDETCHAAAVLAVLDATDPDSSSLTADGLIAAELP